MENIEQGKENLEKKYRYTYRDYSNPDKIIFECVAHDILEADKMYQEKTGKDPEKQNNVGCSMEEIKEN